tara:strand:+ start:1326 stop:2216 length:891 start_codon:yes stop_codon:yes gene_type:complete
MSWLSSALRKAAPVVQTVGPFLGPYGQAAAVGASVVNQDTARKVRSEQRRVEEKEIKKFKESFNMEIFSGGVPSTGSYSPMRPTTQNAGFFSNLGSNLSGFFSGAGDVIRSFGQSGIPQLFGMGRTFSSAQQPAITTVTNVGAQESQGSGAIQAGFGSALAPVLSGARSLLKSPIGQVALGGGAALATLIGPDGKKKRITRKMKSQARTVLNIVGGDLNAAANILGISTDELVFVLLKRFRNDGPMVTKAAVRKTRSTIRKLHMMKGILDDVSKKTPTRRRTGTTFSRRGTITSKI